MTTPTIAKSVLTDRNSVYKARDVIEIFIPPEDVPLLNPNETYLKAIIQLSGNSLHQPDERAGVHSLIREVQIYDGQNQQLLEQLENYNNWTAQKFHYDKTPGLTNLRALMEGQSRVQGNFLTSLYWSGNAVPGTIAYRPVEVCIPLHMSGILSGRKVFPCLLTNGLRIRITLAEQTQALLCFTQVGVVNNVPPAIDAATAGVEAPVATEMNNGVGGDAYFESAVAIAAAATPTLTLRGAGATAPNINATAGNVPFRKGQQVGYQDTAGKIFNAGIIDTIAVAGANIVITLTAPFTPAAADVAAIGAEIFVFSSSMTADYEVRNVDMICSVVQASQQVLSGMMKKVASGSVKLDYNSFNIYRDNLNSRVNRPNINFNTTEHRAMSVVSFPMGTSNSLQLTNFKPVRDGMTSYQYNIANRLTPNRRVDVARVAALADSLSWNAIHQHELEKALARWKTAPRFLANNSNAFAIGRELAKIGHSFNANDQEVRLDLEYSTAAADNTQEKLLNTWVYHIRTLVISPGSIAVVY
tara:strand:- start:10242 stop:11828 length:1587 start_codon:yes stop_codon:yes gene_type:complete